MYAAIGRSEEGGPIGDVEKAMIGSLILAPYNRLASEVVSLKEGHFSSRENWLIFDAVMHSKHPEASLVTVSLHQKHPGGHWGVLVGECLSDTLVEDEAVVAAANAIRGAGVARAAAARLERTR
jgi:hypothetical protein